MWLNTYTPWPNETLPVYKPWRHDLALLNAISLSQTWLAGGIRQVIFTPEQWANYIAEQEKLWLRYQYAWWFFPIPSPVVVQSSIAEELFVAAQQMRQVMLDLCSTSPEAITQRLKGRGIVWNWAEINVPEINAQLYDLVSQHGFLPPMLYDVIVAYDQSWVPRLQCVEYQSWPWYIGWLDLMHDCVEAVDGAGWMSHSYGDPNNILAQLKTLVPEGEEIIVIDTNATGWPTWPDKLLMATSLWWDGTLPLSLLNLEQRDDWQWRWRFYHTNGDFAHERPIKNVLCRVADSDLKSAADTLSGDLNWIETINQFLRDDTIRWIRHPSRSNLRAKPDLGELSQHKATEQHASIIFHAWESMTAWDYRLKPAWWNSNSWQSNITVWPGESYVVPDGYIAQQRFNLYPIPSFIPWTDGSHHSCPATVELRIYLPIGVWSDKTYNMVARIAPRYLKFPISWDEPLEETATNVGGIINALRYIQAEDESSKYKHDNMPFGFTPVLIQHKDIS